MKIHKFSLASAALALCISVPVAYAHGGGSDGDRDRGRDNDRSECPCQISFNKVSKAVRGDNKVLHDEYFSGCVTEERNHIGGTPANIFSGKTQVLFLDSEFPEDAALDLTGFEGAGLATAQTPDAGTVLMQAYFTGPLATTTQRECNIYIAGNGGTNVIVNMTKPLTNKDQYRACARDFTEIGSDLGLKCPK